MYKRTGSSISEQRGGDMKQRVKETVGSSRKEAVLGENLYAGKTVGYSSGSVCVRPSVMNVDSHWAQQRHQHTGRNTIQSRFRRFCHLFWTVFTPNVTRICSATRSHTKSMRGRELTLCSASWRRASVAKLVAQQCRSSLSTEKSSLDV